MGLRNYRVINRIRTQYPFKHALPLHRVRPEAVTYQRYASYVEGDQRVHCFQHKEDRDRFRMEHPA